MAKENPKSDLEKLAVRIDENRAHLKNADRKIEDLSAAIESAKKICSASKTRRQSPKSQDRKG